MSTKKTHYLYIKGNSYTSKGIFSQKWCDTLWANETEREPHQAMVTSYKGELDTRTIHFFEIIEFFTPQRPSNWKPRTYKEIKEKQLQIEIQQQEEKLQKSQTRLIDLKLQQAKLEEEQEEINKKILTEEDTTFKRKRIHGY